MNTVMIAVWMVTSIITCIAWIAANIASIYSSDKYENIALQMEGMFIFSSIMFHMLISGV